MFQSSPTPKGGRYPTPGSCRPLRRFSSKFQSSPTSKGGRYTWYFEQLYPMCPVMDLFQSSPTSKGGRYAMTFRRELGAVRDRRFNPRPPRKVGATRFHACAWRLTKTWNPFQSSPTSKGGRYLNGGSCIIDVSIKSFQSFAHLERWALRQRWLLTRRPTCDGVSILAHLERWALRLLKLKVACLPRIKVFQSSPTSKGGRYDARIRYVKDRQASLVSILAHLERWALHLVTPAAT